MGAGRRTDPCSSNQVGTGHRSRLAGKGGCMPARPSSATWENMVVASGEDGQRGAQGQRKGRDPQAHTETWAACTPAHEPTEHQRERSYTDARRQRQRRGAKLVQTLWPRGGHLAAKPSTSAPHPLHVQPMASGTPACIFPINPPFVFSYFEGISFTFV